MLVLTRKEGERIRLVVPPSAEPTVIWLTQCEVDIGRARIGVDAPRGVEVMREELIGTEPKRG